MFYSLFKLSTLLLRSFVREKTGRYLHNRPPKTLSKNILSEAFQHLKENPYADPLSEGTRWDHYRTEIRKQIYKLKDIEALIHYAQATIGFDHRESAFLQRKKIYELEQHIHEAFPNFSNQIYQIEESPFSSVYSLYKLKNRVVSNVHYWHLYFLLQNLTWAKKPSKVCEIGGGYGGLARLWMQNPIHTPELYCIIDFPEALFFAEIFLKLNLQKGKVLYIDEFLKKDSYQNTVVLCPIHKIDSLNSLSFDLSINTGSFQEMNEKWIKYWMKWVDQAHIHYFYSINYFAQPISALNETENFYSPRFSKKWTARLCDANPYFIKLQTFRHYAELFFEKTDTPLTLEELQNLYQNSKNKILDQQNLLYCMDLIRQCDDQEMIYDLILRCKESMTYLPKELLYLVQISNNKKDLKELRTKLNKFLTHTKKCPLSANLTC